MVSHADLGHIQAFAYLVGLWSRHDHGTETGRTVGLQLVNGGEPGTVLIATGEMADQVLQSENIQSGKLLCLGGTHTF